MTLRLRYLTRKLRARVLGVAAVAQAPAGVSAGGGFINAKLIIL